jgi:hypothetical protein
MIKKILIGVACVLALIAGAIWASKALTTVKVSAKEVRFNQDIENLFIGLQKYKERLGQYPIGSNAEVAKALNGQNPKGVMVIVGKKSDLNEKGEFVDQYGTPLRIYFGDNAVLIRSAGPNRRFDDSNVIDGDDYVRSN